MNFVITLLVDFYFVLIRFLFFGGSKSGGVSLSSVTLSLSSSSHPSLLLYKCLKPSSLSLLFPSRSVCFLCACLSLSSLSLSLSRSACWLCIHYLVFEKIKGMQKTQSPKRKMNDLENSCDFLRLPFCLKCVVSLFVSLLDRCGNVFCVCV